MPRAAPEVQSASETVARLLRREIESGRLPPGAPLRQDELAAQFGKSRIPVREALRALQAEGLVEYLVNRGAVVASASPKDVLEMLEVRIALETHAIRLAVPRMVPAEIDRAREILHLYDESPEPADWSEMNARFHTALCAACECERLMRAIESNYAHFNRFARAALSSLAGKGQPQKEHYELLELAAAGNADGAAALLERHIRGTQKLVQGQARLAAFGA